jgi:hypothetical protein
LVKLENVFFSCDFSLLHLFCATAQQIGERKCRRVHSPQWHHPPPPTDRFVLGVCVCVCQLFFPWYLEDIGPISWEKNKSMCFKKWNASTSSHYFVEISHKTCKAWWDGWQMGWLTNYKFDQMQKEGTSNQSQKSVAIQTEKWMNLKGRKMELQQIHSTGLHLQDRADPLPHHPSFIHSFIPPSLGHSLPLSSSLVQSVHPPL